MTTINRYAVIPQIDTADTNLLISGTTAASPFDCRAVTPLGFFTPTNWLAASVTFKALPYLLPNVVYPATGPLNADLGVVYDETDLGAAYTIVTQSGLGYYRLPPTLFNAVRYLNLTSSVSQTNSLVSLILPPLWQGIHA